MKNEQIHNEESYYSAASNSNNLKKTKLTIKLKSKYQNDNNFFFSILKANGEFITNKDFTQNYSKSEMSSYISDKKYEIEKNLEKIQLGNAKFRSRNNKFDLMGNKEQLHISNHVIHNNNSMNKPPLQIENGDFSQNEISELNNNRIKFRSINVNINENKISNINQRNNANYENYVENNLHLNLNLNLHSYVHPHHSAIKYMDNSKNFSLNDLNKNLQNHVNLNTFSNNNDLEANNKKDVVNKLINKIPSSNNNMNISKATNQKNDILTNKSNIQYKNSILYNNNNSKNSHNLPHEASNLSNKYSNEIQIRSNLQIKDLSKNNSINQGNSTYDKIKNYQKIQKIKMNFDSIKPKVESESNKFSNTLSNNKDGLFKSTIDEVFSSEKRDILTKEPSLRSNLEKEKGNIDIKLDPNHIILEKKLNDYNENVKIKNRSDNKFKNEFENSPALVLNEIDTKISSNKTLQNTNDTNRNKNSNKNKSSIKNVLYEKTNNNSSGNDCYKQFCCMK